MLTRRDLLKIIGLASVAGDTTLLARDTIPVARDFNSANPAISQAVARTREPLQALSATEADVLDAIVARLIPTDDSGPGATEARAVRYIDRALAGALVGSREAYRVGLAAIDRYSRSSRGSPFVALSPRDQNSVLIDVETGAATGSNAGFLGSSAVFFALVRTHTIQGTFGDPYYGGNADFVGWDLLGYPGVRTVVTQEEQRLGVTIAPTHRSAYDHDMFIKASARANVPEGPTRGD